MLHVMNTSALVKVRSERRASADPPYLPLYPLMPFLQASSKIVPYREWSHSTSTSCVRNRSRTASTQHLPSVCGIAISHNEATGSMQARRNTPPRLSTVLKGTQGTSRHTVWTISLSLNDSFVPLKYLGRYTVPNTVWQATAEERPARRSHVSGGCICLPATTCRR